VKEEVFPEGYFELRKKVKFSVPAEATAAEKKTFKSKWADTRDKFLLQTDQELFVGVKKPASAPAPKEPGFEVAFTIAGILAVACMVLRRNG
jgi:PGF-CTERM protein